jgi:hypothetical protein
MGHMSQKRQNIQSTKEKVLGPEDEDITPWGRVEKHTWFLQLSLIKAEKH